MSWALLFSFVKGKRYVLPLAVCVILTLNFLTDNRIFNEVQQVFASEVKYSRGDLESKYVFSGRVGIWSSYLDQWAGSPLINKFIGDGRSHGFFHNEYLRLLIAGGILLLSYFIILAIIIFIKTIYNYRKHREYIHFAALLCFVYFVVESLGQLPGLYPDMQMLIWGIIGLSFNSGLNWILKRKVPVSVR
jgi:O-antigen ligase